MADAEITFGRGRGSGVAADLKYQFG